MSVPKYPWDHWLDGSPVILYAGRDFRCSPSTMEQQVRNAARARGLLVSVRRHPDNPRNLVVKATGVIRAKS